MSTYSKKMDNSTTFNGSLFSLNITDIENSNTLMSPIDTWTIIRVAVCSIGILANCLVIVVITLTSLRTSAFMNLIMALAFFDTILLLSSISSQRGIFGEIFFEPSLFNCRLHIFIVYVCGIASSWVTVLISLERYIAIIHPFKVHVYCTKKRLSVMISVLTILVCTASIPSFYSGSVIFVDQRPVCLSTGIPTTKNMIFIFIVLILYNISPFVLITVLNVFVIRKIQIQNAFRARFQGQHHRQTSCTNSASLVAMMVSVSVVFAVTTIPGTFVLISKCTCYFTDGLCLVIEEWVYHVVFMLDDINHSVNFFLYCLTGSSFRLALFKLFKCKSNTRLNSS